MKRRVSLKKRQIWPVRDDKEFNEYLSSKKESLKEKRKFAISIRRKKFFLKEVKKPSEKNLIKIIFYHSAEVRMYKYACERVRESFQAWKNRQFDKELLLISRLKG